MGSDPIQPDKPTNTAKPALPITSQAASANPKNSILAGDTSMPSADVSGNLFPQPKASPMPGLQLETGSPSTNQNAQTSGDTIDQQTQKNIIESLKIYLNESRQEFAGVRNSRGIFSRFGNFIGRQIDSQNTIEANEQLLNQFESKIQNLENAMSGKLINPSTGATISFGQAYKDAFGKEISEKDIIEWSNAQKKYNAIKPLQEDYERYSDALSPFIQEYETNHFKLADKGQLNDLETSMKSLLGDESFSDLFKQKGVNSDTISPQEKYDFLISAAKTLVSTKIEKAQEVRQGMTLDTAHWLYQTASLETLGNDNYLDGRIRSCKDYQEKAGQRVGLVTTTGTTLAMGGLNLIAGSLVDTAVDTVQDATRDNGFSTSKTLRSLAKNANPLSPLTGLAQLTGIIEKPPSYAACKNVLSSYIEDFDKNKGQLKKDSDLTDLGKSIDSLLGEGKTAKILKSSDKNNNLSAQDKYNILIYLSKDLILSRKMAESA